MPETDLLTQLHVMASQNILGVYFLLAIAPFMQEDAAVVAAASLSLGGLGNSLVLFVAVGLGLTVSVLWKYWLGRAARSRKWAQRFAAKPSVEKAQALVANRLGVSTIAARFVPGTRIPFYVAAGFFKAPWWSFAGWGAVSVVLYTGVMFALFHAVGAVAGEAAVIWLPAVAIFTLLGYVAIQKLRARK